MKSIKKRSKVIMLPTSDKSANLMLCLKSFDADEDSGEVGGTKGKLTVGFGEYSDNEYYEKQHLYLVTDEEIKEGDWVYNKDASPKVYLHSQITNKLLANEKKIVATTDNNLGYGDVLGAWYHLPNIFELYAEEGGIDNIELEYHSRPDGEFVLNGYKSENLIEYVIIYFIKDNWNREELDDILIEVLNLGMEIRQNQLNGISDKSGKELLEDWKKENL